MKVLVLGADGMLGHQVARRLAPLSEVVAVVRTPPSTATTATLEGCRIVAGFDARDPDDPSELLGRERPDVVVNAIGFVKQRMGSSAIEIIELNALLPHRLASLCAVMSTRLIHISTDCVFAGDRGNYTETDRPDPVDLYGWTKLIGEVTADGCLTLRTSIIGLELARASGLVEWFLSQPGPCPGWTRARWNGLTTHELAGVIAMVLSEHPALSGLWHVGAEPVTKHDLLASFAALTDRPPPLPDDSVVIDRTLNHGRLDEALGYRAPEWETMLAQLACEVRQRRERRVV